MHTTRPVRQGTSADRRPNFRILGSLEVLTAQGPLTITGALRRRVLAMLLLDAGRVIPVSRLVEAGWDDDPPESAAHQVRKAVAGLRHRLPAGAELIVTDGPGYRAVVDEDQLDLLSHRRLLRRAHEAGDEGRREQAAVYLREALDLWRGPVLAGSGGPVIDAMSTALEEQRLAAAEKLYELAIEAGDSASVIGELRSLASQFPLRETLRGRLMLALYHSGQQAAALDEFQQIRQLLAEELGIDPSSALCELHADILRQEPALGPPERSPGRAQHGGTSPSVPRTLPYDVPDFSGRASELERIRASVDRAREGSPTVIAIDGMGGGGKTALAVRAAHQLAQRYPDGQLFVDLRGFTPGQKPLSTFCAQGDLLAAAGIPSEEIPGVPAGRSALWQSYARGRRMLLILDNADTSEQVRTLIPASPGSLTLVTSRPRLTDLDGVTWISLGALPEVDSHEILRHSLGAERVEREPEAAAELLRLCGGLPLAVRIATARLSNRPRWTVQRLVDRMQDHGRRLDELSSEDRGVASALSLSYASLPDAQRTAFRLLGHHPGRYIDLGEAAALLDQGALEAEDLLERLVDVRLLEAREPGTYAFHDLVRHFARRVAQGEADPQDQPAVERLLDHYLDTAERACDTLFPGRTRYGGAAGATDRPAGEEGEFTAKESALRWLDRHRDSLLAAVDIAHGKGLLRHAARLPRELGFHSSIRSYDLEANGALETGLAASRQLADPALMRLNLTNLAMGQWRLGRIRDTITHLEDALELSRSMNDRRSEAECKARLGQAYNSLGELRRALRLSEEANRMARETGFARLRLVPEHAEPGAGAAGAVLRGRHHRPGGPRRLRRAGRDPAVGRRAQLSRARPRRHGPLRRGARPGHGGGDALRGSADAVGPAVAARLPCGRPAAHGQGRGRPRMRRPGAGRGRAQHGRHPSGLRPSRRRPYVLRAGRLPGGAEPQPVGPRDRRPDGAPLRGGPGPGRHRRDAGGAGRPGGRRRPAAGRLALRRHGRAHGRVPLLLRARAPRRAGPAVPGARPRGLSSDCRLPGDDGGPTTVRVPDRPRTSLSCCRCCPGGPLRRWPGSRCSPPPGAAASRSPR